MSNPTFRALCAELVALDNHCVVECTEEWADVMCRVNAALAQPEPESAAVQLAARPLLEKAARMADCIDQRTVGEIMAISGQATAWLEANPPGQPIAIEPRGCPTPGACSCVEPVAQPEPQRKDCPGCEGTPVASNSPCAVCGRAQSEPVPVSERLPGPEDWDVCGRCWMFDPCNDGWWAYRSALPSDDELGRPPWTHWLPHWALPMPTPTS